MTARRMVTMAVLLSLVSGIVQAQLARGQDAASIGPAGPTTAGHAAGQMPVPTEDWQVTRVDTPGKFFYMGSRSLVLDATGAPHIAYGGDFLYYTSYDGGTWQRQIVDTSDSVGYFTSLRLDAAGYPHISYFDAKNADLKYAWYDGTSWHTTTVDSAGDVGQFNSLVLDAAGYPHISYFRSWPECDLLYARFDGTSWLTETVASDGWSGFYTSLALDSAGHPQISYYQVASYHILKYASYDGNSWSIETVEDGLPTWGGSTSLVLDSADRPHISYFGFYGYLTGLKYAYYDGTGWIREHVDTSGNSGWETSLVLDSLGRPQISYFDGANSRLKYARYNGTSWVIETVDVEWPTGRYTSLALDPLTGQPRISYCLYDTNNDTCQSLRYARHDGTTWLLETVEVAGDAGACTSLALDAAGHPHISYMNLLPHEQLKYASYDGANWHVQTTAPASLTSLSSIPTNGSSTWPTRRAPSGGQRPLRAYGRTVGK